MKTMQCFLALVACLIFCSSITLARSRYINPGGADDAPMIQAGTSRAGQLVGTKDIIFYDSLDPKTGQITGGEVLREDSSSCRDGDGASIVSEERPDTCNGCVPLIYNGDPSAKLDVIFIATHFYPETGPGSLFAQNVDLMLAKFLAFPKFVENATKINFYRVDCIDPDDECVELGMNPICFNMDKLRALASHCPGYDPEHNDQIVVLFNGAVAPFSAARAEPGFAYMPSNMHPVMIHEFGHSFAGLGDEYVIDATTLLDPVYPNAASDTPGYTCAEKWGDLIGQGGVGCYSGCKYLNWYRPTFNNCVMRNHRIDHFCAVCARHVDNQLSVYDDITSVALRSFVAERDHHVAVLRWQVGKASADHVGFHVYRSEGSGLRERISDEILSGETNYEFIDVAVPFGQVDYWLQETTTTGEDYWYGPVSLAAVSIEAFPLALQQNYPNPFNPTTTISFVLPERAHVNMSIFSVEGKLIKTLIDKALSDGLNEATWDGTDANGNPVSSGVYLYRLKAGKKTITKKMVLLK